MCLAFYVACWIRDGALPFKVSLHNVFIGEINPYRFLFLFWVIISILILNLSNLYQTRREMPEGVELWLVIRSMVMSSIMMAVGIYIFKLDDFPRSIFVILVILSACLLFLWRAAKKIFVQSLVKGGYNNFNVLIVGAGKVGLALAEEIQKRSELGIKIIGFLDDYKTDLSGKTDVKILGKLEDFSKIAKTQFIHKIFITIHHDSNVFLQLLEDARDLEIAVRVVPQGFALTGGEFAKYNIGFIPILEYCDNECSNKQIGKRLFDVVASLFGFIFLFPVFVVIGILIKVDSSGPIIYKSRRYGRRGKIFNMYKFRSMTQNAEDEMCKFREHNEVDGPIFKIKNDPRVTRFGRLLRKYSLDELPQIFNVLMGDMSLVGPRPFPIDQIEREDLKQLKRLEVRPGITGLWQIRGRSDISFTRLIRWDIWYINNWSFLLDLTIILKTIPVVIKGRGAY
jgi:exopolysaccharide biosynthesis polyprenyl glycosylphosphotransferase